MYDPSSILVLSSCNVHIQRFEGLEKTFSLYRRFEAFRAHETYVNNKVFIDVYFRWPDRSVFE